MCMNRERDADIASGLIEPKTHSSVEFIEKASHAVKSQIPGIRVCAFGHIGDGNIHYNLTQPPDMDKQAFLDNWECLNRIVHDIVVDMNGSISAEHGIGLLKNRVQGEEKS